MPKQKSVFLEVDPKIFESNLLLKETNEANDLDNIFRFNQTHSKEDGPWKLVTPSPGFVIKTSDSRGSKVFINLCKADEIPPPKDLTEAELLILLESDDITDYKVPLSMLDPHNELDKSGKQAVVYDVAMNTEFFEKLKENSIFRTFIIQVVQEGLENKYNIELKREAHVILRNRSCVGELKPHRIRNRKGPYQPPSRLIEEVDFSSRNQKFIRGDLAINHTQDQLSQNLKYRLVYGNNVLIAQFHLHNVRTWRDIDLDVGENRIILGARNFHRSVDIFLPCTVNEYKTYAYFNQTRKILTILMSCASRI